MQQGANLWHGIEPGNNIPDEINVIIEIPRGSKNKYEIDKETGLIKLDRAMKTAQDYPFDYGFVPRTLWHDNDALDVIVLTTNPLHPGILVEVRPVGVMRMVDGGESDDKIISVPLSDPRWDSVQDLQDVNAHTLKEARHFFETYKQIDQKVVTIEKIEGADAAKAAVKEGIELYNQKFA